MKLSEAIYREGFIVTLTDAPENVPGGIGEPVAGAFARIYRQDDGLHGIAIRADSWDWAYSAAHEIAEYRHGFNHSADMFAEQANILARWIKYLARE